MPFLFKTLAILIGSLIFASGVDFFLVPFHLLDGGIIGIGLIISYLWGFKTGFVIMICSIPIFLLSWFRYRNYFFNSIHGMLVSSLFIDLLTPYQSHFLYYVRLTPLLSSIVGGLIVGLGIGIMLKFETSTGGTDLLAQLISRTISINVGIIIFIIDAIVICIGGILITPDTFFLSMLTIVSVGITTSICTWTPQKNMIV